MLICRQFPMGSIPITRSTPRQRQASCGNGGGGKILIAWVISWLLRLRAVSCRCRGLPQHSHPQSHLPRAGKSKCESEAASTPFNSLKRSAVNDGTGLPLSDRSDLWDRIPRSGRSANPAKPSRTLMTLSA